VVEGRASLGPELSIDKLTFKLGPTQLTDAEQKKIQEALAKARD
jgi:hypothetical protein